MHLKEDLFLLRINTGTKLNSLKISITFMREYGNTEEPYKMSGKSINFLIFPCNVVLLIFQFLNWKILTESRAHHIAGLVMINRLQLNLCLQFEWIAYTHPVYVYAFEKNVFKHSNRSSFFTVLFTAMMKPSLLSPWRTLVEAHLLAFIMFRMLV